MVTKDRFTKSRSCLLMNDNSASAMLQHPVAELFSPFFLVFSRRKDTQCVDFL